MLEQEPCTFLTWDSQFFDYRIARVKASRLSKDLAYSIEQFCQDQAIDCLYFLADSDDAETVRLAEDFAYRFHDIRLVLEHDLSKILQLSPLAQDFLVRSAQKSDLSALLPMTQETFIHSRFYYDPHFTAEQCNRLYQTWLERSVEEDFADEVLVIAKNGEAMAYVTCKLDKTNQIGSIGLVGVAEAARGQNLGNYLMYHALNYFQESGMKKVEVVTQGRNIAAQRLYQKAGFRTSQVQLWYHKWFTELS